ncbi:hypothetical protein F5Y15DRAFT_405183 [Xylariaceae sp. FL0016]|nr:hypothetical protein F5Y15DRAFT_405183 [Xylariaceae sp. FL0016]
MNSSLEWPAPELDLEGAHFRRCWGTQDCRSCLQEPDCSWCPISFTCVPNSYRIQFLKPAYDGDLTCPHWTERWEIRTRPLGCYVSTITTLTAIVTILSTLFVVGFVAGAVTTTVKLRRYVRERQGGNWRFWRWNLKKLRRIWVRFRRLGARKAGEDRNEDGNGAAENEDAPLLPSSRTDASQITHDEE